MFLGYPVSQWIGLLEYCGIILVLSIFTGVMSCILANKSLHKKRNKLNKKFKKKSCFIDVA